MRQSNVSLSNKKTSIFFVDFKLNPTRYIDAQKAISSYLINGKFSRILAANHIVFGCLLERFSFFKIARAI